MTIEECKALLPSELKYPLPIEVIDNLLDTHAIFIKCDLENENMNYALLAALIELKEHREQEGEGWRILKPARFAGERQK